jgi:hypothetical protein
MCYIIINTILIYPLDLLRDLNMSKKDGQSLIVDDLDTPEISAKSKKNEIFDAYQELLTKMSENKQMSHQEVKKKQDEQVVVAKATGFGIDRIIANIADVKCSIGQSLESLEQKLATEYRRLHDLQEAIRLEAAHLEEFHQIKKNVDTLSALLLAQKECKVNFDLKMQEQQRDFDQEMHDKRLLWKKEQEAAEQERKERELSSKKERVREVEEYQYATTLERKKDHDLYQVKKTTLERELDEKKTRVMQELDEREQKITFKEVEFEHLANRVAQFPAELERSVQENVKVTRESLERDYRFQMDIAAKELDGERKLNVQTITTLQQKIKEQDAFIRTLTQKTDEAGNQVQTIALKALESSSYARYYASSEDGKKGHQGSGS